MPKQSVSANPKVQRKLKAAQQTGGAVAKSLSEDKDNNNSAKKAALRNLPVQANPGMPNKADAKTTMDSWAKRMNPYYQTLAHPTRYMGVRIPDDCTIRTSTFTIVKRFAITVTSSGVAAAQIGQSSNGGVNCSFLIPNLASSSVGGVATTYVIGYSSKPNATESALFSAAADATGSPPIVLGQWDATTDSVPDLISNVRLVSGSLSVKSTVSTMNNSGMFTGAFLPKGFINANSSVYHMSGITADLLAELPGSVQVPVSDGSGLEIKYQPIDSTCTTYVDVNVDASALTGPDNELYNPGGFIWCVTGAYAGSTIQCSLCLNYEGIPRSNTLLFQNAVDSAVSDPIAVAEAMNNISKEAPAMPGTDESEALHSNEFSTSGLMHPVISRMGLGTSMRSSASAIKIHDSAIACTCGKNEGQMKVAKVKQDESLFSKLANMVGKLAVEVGPKIVSSMV